MRQLRMAVVGAGVIGRTHLQAILGTPGCSLSGLVEPGPGAGAAAAEFGCPVYSDLDALIADRPDGAIIATPNETHVPLALRLIEAGIPVLVEKPLATDMASARVILEASTCHGVPVLTAHHRRYNPIILAARDLVASERFGRFVQGSVLCSLKKPDSYFDVAWRTLPGSGGPMLINLIHEIDLLRFLLGEVESVTGIASNSLRGLPVEDTAGAILTFREGGVVTLSVSDAAAAPFAWDISANENPGRFPAHPVSSHFFCGTDAGFTLPDMTVWTHPGEKSWTNAMTSAVHPVTPADSYIGQIAHFGAVIRGEAEPRCSGLDGARNLAIIDALRRSSASGQRMVLDPDGLGANPVDIKIAGGHS